MADVFHFKIHIIESGSDFVEAVTNATLPQEQCTIIEHVEEFHFLSTSSLVSTTSSIDDNSSL